MLESATSVAESPAATPTLAELAARLSKVEAERDEYKRVYVLLLEAYRKLELGLTRHERERFVGSEEQMVLSGVLSMLAPGRAPEAEGAKKQTVEKHERTLPTGRKPLPETLPRIEVEVLPPEVQRQGLDAFERIGENVTETVERRAAALVVVRTVRGKFVPKAPPAQAAAHPPEVPAAPPLPAVLQALAPQLPIPRCIAGPGLLADSLVKRWDDHLPLHRLERVYGRDGLQLARSTICGWHFEAAELFKALVDAMLADALTCPFVCVDATGVLVQNLEKCRNGHFFVLVAPPRHVLFRFSPKHNSDAVKKLLGGYTGTLLADAHSVYDCLYVAGRVIEAGCWSHARRYWFKALDSDRARATRGLTLIRRLFLLEREYEKAAPEKRLRLRQEHAKPIVAEFFAWCDDEALKVLDETPVSKAIGYARNQRVALERFLQDGRIPIHNNASENALRREALGRRNWLFLGSDEGGEVNATVVSLLASCRLHDIEPAGYLRDLLCLLPAWPKLRVLELAPAYWRATMERPDVQEALAANVFRQVSLGNLEASRSIH